MKTAIIISGLSILIITVLFFGTSFKPIKIIGQTFVKILIGALLLFFLNAFGNQFGIHVPINLITATISGILGIPGVLALTTIQLWVLV
ncbi:pro-sigmaK processing inhibitor BofA family protein [Bacillus kwashiorkori]|uniref:pro-sigmaK processing inhibitor BofA family protein n=1 Tax=Bacillus kwashiorkori TaxID=1522318 RepID=UPI0007863537|nr:pro-sigmaK processing inhibitor BofA family protein [Bacillus kwashiorkori]